MAPIESTIPALHNTLTRPSPVQKGPPYMDHPSSKMPPAPTGDAGDSPQSAFRIPQSADTRRPFEPPELLWSEPFQPVAYGMSCAKISGQSQQCDAFPQLS